MPVKITLDSPVLVHTILDSTVSYSYNLTWNDPFSRYTSHEKTYGSLAVKFISSNSKSNHHRESFLINFNDVSPIL